MRDHWRLILGGVNIQRVYNAPLTKLILQLPGCLKPQAPVLGTRHFNQAQHYNKHLGERLQEDQHQGGRRHPAAPAEEMALAVASSRSGTLPRKRPRQYCRVVFSGPGTPQSHLLASVNVKSSIYSLILVGLSY